MTLAGVRWSALCAVCIAGAAGTATADEFRISLSVSPFTEQVLNRNIAYSDGTSEARTTAELQKIFVAHGANEVYARIGTLREFQRGNGDHSVNRGLERARLARELGLPFNPEIGLFRSYGDITHQPAPDFKDYPQIALSDPWTSLDIARMTGILRTYGALIAQEILDTGVKVRIWDLGNEVEYGVAGVAIRPLPGFDGRFPYAPPDAIDPEIGKMSIIEISKLPEGERIAWLQKHLWPHMAKLFAAAAEGIRSVDPQARFSTHLSGDAANSPALGVAFYQAMREGGFDPDELGFSYYPTSTNGPADRLQAFKETATRVHRELKRPIFIAEFGYPAGQMTGIFSWNVAAEGYPQTADGQSRFTRDLIEWGVREKVLSGIRPWAPDFVFGWEPMSFFSLDGKSAQARPGLDAIRQGLRNGMR